MALDTNKRHKMIILQFACMKEICNIRFCSDLGLVCLPFHISSQSLTLVLGSCSWETRTHNLNQRSVLLCSGKPLSKEHEVGASEARREHLPSQPEQLNQSWKSMGWKMPYTDHPYIQDTSSLPQYVFHTNSVQFKPGKEGDEEGKGPWTWVYPLKMS